MPYARLALCWRTADAWREESGEDFLDPLVFAIQDQLYEPSPLHSRELMQAFDGVPRTIAAGPNRMRARRAQGLVALVKGTAASLLDHKSFASKGGFSRPYRSAYYYELDFAAFLAKSLWVFETETLADWIAQAIGEHLLYEGGDWCAPGPKPLWEE